MNWSIRLAGLILAGGPLLVGCNGSFPWPNSKTSNEQETWIVVLGEFSGPGRHKLAKTFHDGLTERGWGGVGLIHDSNEQRSLVYMGPFTYAQLPDQIKQIREFKDASGQRPFASCYERQLPLPNPQAPADWNLVNAPANAFWSLQIGHYVDPGPAFHATRLMQLPPGWNRRQAVVDACGELRKLGYEAFFYHGPNMSLLTIGAFPQDAFIARPTDPRQINYDPIKDEFLDERISKLRNIVMKDSDGKDDTPFRYNHQNGLKLIKGKLHVDGQMRYEPERSFLVEIPRPSQDIEQPAGKRG